MITTPKLTYQGPTKLLTNYGCGRIGMENDRRAFWQSRATLAGRQSPPFEVVDPRALATAIRVTWPR